MLLICLPLSLGAIVVQTPVTCVTLLLLHLRRHRLGASVFYRVAMVIHLIVAFASSTGVAGLGMFDTILLSFWIPSVLINYLVGMHTILNWTKRAAHETQDGNATTTEDTTADPL
jgi:hypothetical protein